MGKWTLEHHDEVLRSKMKNMVQGAVKRMSTEKEGPSISYEAFVEELDEGDSFTTALIDVLVKEMAERRTRPNPIDRRLISERTAKALRMQAAPLHIYRGPSTLTHRSRRGVPVMPPRSYSTFRDLLSESEGEDEYGTVLNNTGPLEGARLNTELYDAYFPSTDDLPGSLSRRSDPPPPSSGRPATHGNAWLTGNPRSQSPPGARPIWPTDTGDLGSGSSGSFLARQPSIRRPHRSRTADFNDFTTRRRSAIRNNNNQDDSARAESPTETGDRSSAPVTGRTYVLPGTGNANYYPFLSWSSTRSSSIPPRSGSAEGHAPARTGAVQEQPSSALGRSPSSSQLWYSMTSATTSTSTAPESAMLSTLTLPPVSREDENERPQVIAPRLRRGGLRPPESLAQQTMDLTSSSTASSQDEAVQNPPSTSIGNVAVDTAVSDHPGLRPTPTSAGTTESPPVPVES